MSLSLLLRNLVKLSARRDVRNANKKVVKCVMVTVSPPQWQWFFDVEGFPPVLLFVAWLHSNTHILCETSLNQCIGKVMTKKKNPIDFWVVIHVPLANFMVKGSQVSVKTSRHTFDMYPTYVSLDMMFTVGINASSPSSLSFFVVVSLSNWNAM